jgi:membrane protease YdiL (CAAX protease family)
MADLTEQPGTKSALAHFAETRPLILFFLLAYAWSWTFWLIVPPFVSDNHPDVVYVLLFIAGATGPTVAALLTRWLSHRDLRICPVWTGWSRVITGLMVGLACFIVVTLVAPSIATTRAPASALRWGTLLHWSVYGINYSTLLGGPLNEEPGWRGFALPRLQESYGPVLATIILAPLWAAWHLPLFQIKGWSSARPWQFLLILIGVSFLMTAAANLSKFSVIVAIVLHAFFNTSSGLGNALKNGLAIRAPEMLIYTLTVFACGTAIGLAVLRLQRTWRRANRNSKRSVQERC